MIFGDCMATYICAKNMIAIYSYTRLESKKWNLLFSHLNNSAPLMCGYDVALKHITTLFSLSDHDIPRREWSVTVNQVQNQLSW